MSCTISRRLCLFFFFFFPWQLLYSNHPFPFPSFSAPLHSHLEEQGVEYIQFAFRWMNCLLMRELSVRNIVRMWDTYLVSAPCNILAVLISAFHLKDFCILLCQAEGPDAFSDFHLYVCSSFLNRWDEELRKMDFQGIIMFLQSLPTQKWTAQETELLLADAFV